MEHYFTNNPLTKSNRKKISFRFLTIEENFVSDNNVFSKDTLDFGSRLLIETIINEKIDGKLLDLGCGIGVIGILLKKYIISLDVYMSDINQRAVDLAIINSADYMQNNKVILSDGFENINDSFDVVVTNPPIRTGKSNIYSMFASSYDHLNQNGRLYIVIQAKQGAASALKYLQSLQANSQVINKKNGYWIIRLQKD